MRTILFASFLALTAGCDCSGNTTLDAGRDTPALDDTPSSDTPALDTPAGDDVPSVDAPAATDAATVVVAIRDFAAFGNCKPVVPPDPMIVTWTVDISGATGATASFVRGELILSGGARVPVTVDVPTIALTGGAAMQAQRRVAGAANPDACTTFCGMGARLEATYLVDGEEFPLSATGNYDCAF